MSIDSILGMFVLSHLPKFTMESVYIDLEIYIGIIVLAIIPIISNYFAGMIGMKHNEQSNSIQSKVNILVNGVIYTLLVIIVSGIFKLVIGSTMGYSISFISLKLILNSILFSVLGLYMAQQKEKSNEISIIDSIIKMSISTMFQGLTLMTVIGIVSIIMIVSSSDMGYMMSFIGINMDNVISPIVLLTSILWGITNLGSISFSVDGESIYKFNLLDFNIEDSNTWIYIIILLIIVSIFYYLKGRKLKKIVSENSYKYPLIFSGIYTIVMLLLFNISKIIVGGDFTDIIDRLDFWLGMNLLDMGYGATMSISFSLITSLISTFIFSFIFISLGYKSNKKEQ